MSGTSQLAALIQERFGLVPRQRWEDQFRKAAAKIAKARGSTERQLLEQATRDPSLLIRLVGAVTVGESYFFRHAHQFDVVVDAARRRLATAGNSFSIWSAGCANGEEPYSIALALREALAGDELARISIVATDLNTEAIARAEAGIFPRWSFRDVARHWVSKYFRLVSPDRHELAREIRRLVTFRHAALQEQLAFLRPSSLDIIFFRNVSVYLTDVAIAEIYRGFAMALHADGLLFVSPTDARPQIDVFRPSSEQDTTVFVRHASSREQEGKVETPQPVDRSLQPPVLCEPTRSCPADALELIDALANQGDLTGALSQITERLQRLGASADLYHRRGHLQMALGNAQAAIEDYRRTLYLAPDDYVARYWYALAARQAGDLELARRQLAMIRDGETQVPEELRHSAAHLIGELKCR